MLPKTSTFNVTTQAEVEHLVQVAKNSGYRYTIKNVELAGCITDLKVWSVTWIRR